MAISKGGIQYINDLKITRDSLGAVTINMKYQELYNKIKNKKSIQFNNLTFDLYDTLTEKADFVNVLSMEKQEEEDPFHLSLLYYSVTRDTCFVIELLINYDSFEIYENYVSL